MFEAEVTVRRTRFASEETGWAVVEAAGEDGTPVVLVGPLVHLEDHERARVVGTWVQDSRYGPQVKVTEATPLAPTDADGPVAIAYLVRVKHVGVKRATRLVETYGAGAVFDVIDRDPHAAFTAAGHPQRQGRRGDELLGAAPRHAAPPSAARPARPGVSRGADPRDLRGRRPPDRVRASV